MPKASSHRCRRVGNGDGEVLSYVEEAYAALGLIETQLDELRTELEWQHKRLDEIRDAQLESTSQEKELGVDTADASRRAHEDWANDE